MASQVARRVGRGFIERPEPKTIPEYASLLKDPAIERWASLKETTTKHFKWTFKTAGMAFYWCFAVPAATFYIMKQELDSTAIAEGKPLARMFPFTLEIPDRQVDPLPPRKPGVKIVHGQYL